MTSDLLVNQDIPYIKPSDSTFRALELLEEYKQISLPVVDDSTLCGLVSEDLLLQIENDTFPVSTIDFTDKDFFCRTTTHYLDVLSTMLQHQHSIIPVLSNDDKYEGLISFTDILSEFSKISALDTSGGIILLKIQYLDYSLSEISRIVESNGAKILISYSENIPDDNENVIITLKINQEDLTHIIATFERFNYQILATFHQSENGDDSKERLSNLFKYLNI